MELTIANTVITALRAKVADFALSKAARGAASRRKDLPDGSPTPSSSENTLDPAELRQGSAIADGKKLDSYIAPLATYFAAFYMPSIMVAAFSRPKPSFAPDGDSRYPAGIMCIKPDVQTGAIESPVTREEYIDGLASDLYEGIPPAYHSYMAKSVQFPKKVSRKSEYHDHWYLKCFHSS